MQVSATGGEVRADEDVATARRGTAQRAGEIGFIGVVSEEDFAFAERPDEEGGRGVEDWGGVDEYGGEEVAELEDWDCAAG